MKKCVICGTEHERNSDFCSKACTDKAYRLRKKEEAVVARPAVEAVMEPVVKKVVKEMPMAKIVKTPTPKVETPKVENTEKEVKEVVSVTRTFEVPVRLFWNRRFEEKNSSCAKPGTELTFEEIGNGEYRVRRGKRNFFANTTELDKAGVSLS